ncbi:MAG: BON domain-containing protein [Bacteroidota bacterium]|nr:BON domain-containing protein [Bacteroidota bacterium]
MRTYAQKTDFAKPAATSPTKVTPTPAAEPAKVSGEAAAQDKKSDAAVKATAKNEAASPAGAPDDASIAKAAQEKLASLPSLKDKNINVSVSGGVVTLTGTVDKPGLKGVATNAVKKLPGVKRVNNQIEVVKN